MTGPSQEQHCEGKSWPDESNGLSLPLNPRQYSTVLNAITNPGTTDVQWYMEHHGVKQSVAYEVLGALAARNILTPTIKSYREKPHFRPARTYEFTPANAEVLISSYETLISGALDFIQFLRSSLPQQAEGANKDQQAD